MTTLGIVRHGSTAWNKQGRAQGTSDIPLNEEGISGVAKLAERLSQEDWDVIYASDLQRAKQTAEMIGEKMGIKKIQFDPRLREAGGGLIEGTTKQERIERWGENWRELDLGMESPASVIRRGTSFVEDVIKNHTDQNILIVSHGSFIRHLLIKLAPDTSTEEGFKNTSVTKLCQRGDCWECELYNCTRHLQEA